MSDTYRLMGAAMTGAADGGLLGAVIAEYRLVRLLGRGGMGRVFEGEHVHNGRRAAIKLVHAELSRNAQVAARFVNESRATSRIDHPGVVRVFEAGQTSDGFSYIVMEYLDGELLAQRLSHWYGTDRENPSSSGKRSAPQHGEQTMWIAWQIADTLSELHRWGIIHRDLKPENIFLVKESGSRDRERAKIFDFGIAKLLQNPSPAADGVSPAELPSPQTKIGTVLGTPIYMSPEQWQGQGQITDRADVYAAGGIFFELFTGFPPFRSQVLGQLLLSHLHQPPPLLEFEAPWLPSHLAEVVQRMLAKEPSARPSMEEVAEIFERHLLATRLQSVPSLGPNLAGPAESCPAALVGPHEIPALLAPASTSALLDESSAASSQNFEADATILQVLRPSVIAPMLSEACLSSSGVAETLISSAQPPAVRRPSPRTARPPGGDRPTRALPAHPTILSGPVPLLSPSRHPPIIPVPAPPASLNIVALCALGVVLTSIAAFLLG